jgi:hypothetical protein
MPELVVHDAEGRPSVVRYHLLVPLLLEELQRQERTLAEQQRRLARPAAASRTARALALRIPCIPCIPLHPPASTIHRIHPPPRLR